MRAVIDSDILIDYLQGVEKAKVELALYPKREISVLSWMEVMIGADDAAEEAACRSFLATFTVHPLTDEVAVEAVKLRRKHKIRLPDAIVWATARVNNCLLVTRNTKDFSAKVPGVRFPYSI